MPSGRTSIRSVLRAVSTCLLLAVFLALSGCGGEGESESDGFTDGYNAAITRLSNLNSELAELDVSAKSSRAIANEFKQFGAALESIRGELAALEPPKRAQQQFDALLAALGDSVDASGRAADAARAIKPARQRRALRELKRATGEIGTAQDALVRAVQETS